MSRHFFTNKHQLRRLLIIEDPAKETIYGVVGRMEILIEYISAQESLQTLLPFLRTYYLVTKAGAQKYVLYKHFFWSLKDFEVLDVHFATLYFGPLFLFLTEGKIVRPWQHYFHYIQRQSSIPILCLLLGINAHINADLYTALVQLNYKHQRDFFWVNSILQEVFPESVYLLAKEKDWIAMGGLAFKDQIETEFKHIILEWRTQAWENAQHTLMSPDPTPESHVLSQTEQLASCLIADFNNIYHFQHLTESIQDLHRLTIKLP